MLRFMDNIFLLGGKENELGIVLNRIDTNKRQIELKINKKDQSFNKCRPYQKQYKCMRWKQNLNTKLKK